MVLHGYMTCEYSNAQTTSQSGFVHKLTSVGVELNLSFTFLFCGTRFEDWTRTGASLARLSWAVLREKYDAMRAFFSALSCFLRFFLERTLAPECAEVLILSNTWGAGHS